jgi:hypothetical protein
MAEPFRSSIYRLSKTRIAPRPKGPAQSGRHPWHPAINPITPPVFTRAARPRVPWHPMPGAFGCRGTQRNPMITRGNSAQHPCARCITFHYAKSVRHNTRMSLRVRHAKDGEGGHHGALWRSIGGRTLRQARGLPPSPVSPHIAPFSRTSQAQGVGPAQNLHSHDRKGQRTSPPFILPYFADASCRARYQHTGSV